MTQQLESELPSRYEALHSLGKGGGGEVWAVRDRHSGTRYALKMLAADAEEGEMAALVREAVTLSGLEGLGVPRVLRFGRLRSSGRPFMVRELVEGDSLQALIESGGEPARNLAALACTAEQVTLLHRAGLLHGDIKPANIIVEPSGRTTLVDLGLATPWKDTGSRAQGLTPKYAAPELLLGRPLTVRAEIYALGVTLDDITDRAGDRLGDETLEALRAIGRRATDDDASARHPSADEFASALRRAAGLDEPPAQTQGGAGGLWPIVGIEATSSRLLRQAGELLPGCVLHVVGPVGSGRSALLRRLAWSLGVDGHPVAWLDENALASPAAVSAELEAIAAKDGALLLVDDAANAPEAVHGRIEQERRRGTRIVMATDRASEKDGEIFEVPPLGTHPAIELVRRAVPSLTERMLRRVVQTCDARPGTLRNFVRSVASSAVVSDDDLERLLHRLDTHHDAALPGDALSRALHFLDRGRFNDARQALDEATDGEPVAIGIARARLHLGLGDASLALDALESLRQQAEDSLETETGRQWCVYMGRALHGVGKYEQALEILAKVTQDESALGAEALAYQGLSLAYTGQEARARKVFHASLERAAQVGSARVEALTHACLGVLLQRDDDTDAARAAYERAIAAAERASDASTLGTAQLNLASILRISGDMAGAIELYEAAIDMGHRSGRKATVRNALLNLANADLYLGRLDRARSSIEALGQLRSAMPPLAHAQLLGLEAELAARDGTVSTAVAAYQQCSDAYRAAGLNMDAAEPRLEGVLVATLGERPDVNALQAEIERAAESLGDSPAFRPLVHLARARLAWVSGDEADARRHLEAALASAREANQRDWIWRTLEARAEIEEVSGQPVSARRDREEALAVLEEIAARLPRDLREVFWNDARRRKLRGTVQGSLSHAATEHSAYASSSSAAGSDITSLPTTRLERRLARILEINTELLGETNLDRLAARVTDHAVQMLKAERGFVLLVEAGGSLRVHTSRGHGKDAPHEEFSRSIAEQVVASGNPVVSMNARGDSKLQSFRSVHQLMLESVACVPIYARSGEAIGALYVETRLRPGVIFERELPTLRAFADQVGIALDIARLVAQNQARADALEESNNLLEAAQGELRELLGNRTAKLKRARQKLRDARETLYGHFGYQGLVGTSEPMRRIYALIDRVKEMDVPVLITGESGTGKEVAARAIHQGSGRSARPLLAVNCGAIPEHLLESELFGHVRGAFTGADRERKGLIREAAGGTVLLDEIGEMPHKMQAGLLRVLQDKKVRPVGGTDEEEVDVRILFATHRNLEKLVREGAFREDLYYRIHVVELRLPPLRERVEDIPPLVDHFLSLFAARYKRDRLAVSRDALRRLAAFEWPGNVRQLEHVLLNAWVLSDGPTLEADDFDLPDGAPRSAHARVPPPRLSTPRSEPRPVGTGSSPRPSKETLSKHRRDEKDRILRALQASNWNRVKAAELSGIPRRTFYRRLREYGIQ